jgi:predicted TIM-barrel enzyme
MTNQPEPDVGTAILAFGVARLPPLPPYTIGLFCPCLDGLPRSRVAETGLLPIHDANGELLRALNDADGLPPGYYAGVLAIDPFRRMSDILDHLQAAGASSVANFPTTGVVDGAMRSTLVDLNMSFEQEVGFLCEARARGMRCAGVVATSDQAALMIEAGIDTLIDVASEAFASRDARLPDSVSAFRLA